MNIDIDIDKYVKELNVDRYTLEDIVKSLKKPNRDPRDEMPQPILKSDILELKDLKVGMQLQGTVRNVVDFGAFVDIGVHQDGLVHISQLADRFVASPGDVVKLGQQVMGRVVEGDLKRRRISLSMKITRQTKTYPQLYTETCTA